ncbi:LysE family translocator [Cryobacterium sp. BB736]|uniref:LysE family translocator n=1 Tax=Cryobacterium sp. BB736 TaxID=2746963 RepID=UPI001876A34F|nr:LysE family translocator [Cryobacterium sp. BB736]
MMPLENLVAFTIAAAVLVAIPGPSVLFVVGRALVLGRRGALLSVVGNAMGVLIQVVAVAAGLGVLIERSVVLFTVIKLVGAAYLIYLGVQAIRHRRRATTADAAPAPRRSRVLRESFVVGISNPKTVVFFIAVLPQFAAPSAGWVPAQLLLLGAIFIALALVLDSVWALAAGSARDWFGRSPKRIGAMSATGGAAMIALGGTLAITSAKA